ncbi:hypothetical protein JTE90_022858, partial [Oedothorax gibbosus]
ALEGVDNTGESALNNLRLTSKLAKKVGCPDNVRDNPQVTMACLKGKFRKLKMKNALPSLDQIVIQLFPGKHQTLKMQMKRFYLHSANSRSEVLDG